MRRFENKTALVSAGAKGIGLGIAERLVAEGARVIVLSRSRESIEAAAEREGMRGVRFEQVDLLDAEATQVMIGRLQVDNEQVDILINNAGGSLHTPMPFFDETDAHWELLHELNVMATVRLARGLLPGMIERGYGRIVNMGSKAGRYGSLFTGANYVAAKGAVQSMTLQLAQEFGPHGITCNAVCPGAILTPRLEGLLAERMSPEERQAVEAQIPMRRHGQVEDVAAAVAFLASEEAGFITGQLIDINGGQAMAS